jgi:predicted nucleotidyltransferase
MQILKTISDHKDELRSRYSVSSLSLFGSVARNQSNPDSDIDLLVIFQESPGILKFLELKARLEEICHAPVDLVTKNALKKQLSDQILKEAIDAF